MSCIVNGANVETIKYGSQNVTKVMQNGVTLWQKDDGLFLAVSYSDRKLYTFKNGIWTDTGSVAESRYSSKYLKYGGGRFVTPNVAYSNLEQASIGTTTNLTTPRSTFEFRCMEYGRGRFIAIYEAADTVSTSMYYAYELIDGETEWKNGTAIFSGNRSANVSIFYADGRGGRFVVSTQGDMYLSWGGSSDFAKVIGSTQPWVQYAKYITGCLCGITETSAYDNYDNDFGTWTENTESSLIGSTGGIARGKTNLVKTGFHSSRRMNNSDTWEYISSMGAFYNDIEYGGGSFITIASSSPIAKLISENGSSWTSVNPPVAMQYVAYGK